MSIKPCGPIHTANYQSVSSWISQKDVLQQSSLQNYFHHCGSCELPGSCIQLSSITGTIAVAIDTVSIGNYGDTALLVTIKQVQYKENFVNLQSIWIIVIKSSETRAVIYTCRYSSGHFNPYNSANGPN